MKSLFLTVEGIDGAGKGTQIAKIVSYFEKKQLPFVLLREPGGTAIGEAIREILLDSKNQEMDSYAELLLFAAARAQLVEEVIRPALAEGKIVICDRFFDSTLAYQAGGRGICQEDVASAIWLATRGLEPHLTLYLDIDPELAAERRKVREDVDSVEADRLELEAISFAKNVREMYLQLVNTHERIVAVDASQDAETVWEAIEKVLDDTIYTEV